MNLLIKSGKYEAISGRKIWWLMCKLNKEDRKSGNGEFSTFYKLQKIQTNVPDQTKTETRDPTAGNNLETWEILEWWNVWAAKVKVCASYAVDACKVKLNRCPLSLHNSLPTNPLTKNLPPKGSCVKHFYTTISNEVPSRRHETKSHEGDMLPRIDFSRSG